MTTVHICLLTFSGLFSSCDNGTCMSVNVLFCFFLVVTTIHVSLLTFPVLFSDCDNGTCLSVNVLCVIF